MFRRYFRQFFATLFKRETESIREKEEEIDKDLAEIEEMKHKYDHEDREKK